ncbi:MAG: conjugative transposon protein TraM [Bacteroidota bacterium]
MSEQYSEKYLRTRKFRIVLPLLIVPIITIFFWLMGGGTVASTTTGKKTGLNTQLPNAQGLKDSSKDKLAFYLAADADSSKHVEQMRMDPYRKDTVHAITEHPSTDVYARVKEIQQRLAVKSTKANDLPSPLEERTIVAEKPAIKVAVDPEMEALNNMLDKISAIQQPKANVAAIVEKPKGFAVEAGQVREENYFGKKRKSTQSFLSDDAGGSEIVSSISAVVPNEQVIQPGSVVKLELKSAVTIRGTVVKAGSLIYGIGSIEGERLLIHIPSIRVGEIILPVSLTVYDLDGLEGIYVPGTLGREVLKESANNAIQSTGISGFDLSIKTQAAAAGIGAAKSLLSKKVKAVRVTIAAGYQVLLCDNNQKNE